jgi:hypothetical protein
VLIDCLYGDDCDLLSAFHRRLTLSGGTQHRECCVPAQDDYELLGTFSGTHLRRKAGERCFGSGDAKVERQARLIEADRGDVPGRAIADEVHGTALAGTGVIGDCGHRDDGRSLAIFCSDERSRNCAGVEGNHVVAGRKCSVLPAYFVSESELSACVLRVGGKGGSVYDEKRESEFLY